MERWSLEQVEDVLNYIRVVLGGVFIEKIYLEKDKICYCTADGNYRQRSFYKIYKQMLDDRENV